MTGDLFILLFLAVAAGITGMLGLKKEKAFCLILSALALPVLVFLALWTGAGLEGASLCLCVTAVPVLLGLPGGPEGEKR